MPLYERHPVSMPVIRPVLVAALEGWIDAGLGAATAMAGLLAEIPTETLATFDTDEFLDQRARRPTAVIVDGVMESLTWPEIQLRVGEDLEGHSIAFLVGPEPDIHWRVFVDAIMELAIDLDVRMLVGLGAFPAPTPHTRPVRLAATSTDGEIAHKIGFVQGSIEVPAGVEAALEMAFRDAGITAVGLWARVPHYASGMPYPAASAALVDGLVSVAGLSIDSSELHSAGDSARTHVEELIAENPKHMEMVRQLEKTMDATEGNALDLGIVPSGDEIAAELQRYLNNER
ncbi:MAG: PAC2 family protein [Actinomycetota bacterium]|nr:PAC2 family protein [Actinomycetota bacterium]